MTEPSSGVPSEIADAEVAETETGAEEPTTVTLDLDEEKLEAWDAVKSDYAVDPDGDAADTSASDDAAGAPTDEADDQPEGPESPSAD